MKALWRKFRKFIRQKRTYIIMGLVILAILTAVFGPNFNTIISLKQQISVYEQELTVEQERSEELDAQLQAVGSREYIEEIAREKYNLYYSNEMIVTPEYEE